jgi:hypothetical protein
LSRRAGRAAQDGAQADTEVAATTTAIAGLRRRLRRQGTVEHPAVRRELRKLEEQLVSLFEQPGRNPGRHRSQATEAHGKQDGDPCEPDLQPGPAPARIPAEHIAVLWH